MRYALFLSLVLHALLWGGSRYFAGPLAWAPAPVGAGPVFVTSIKSPIVARASKAVPRDQPVRSGGGSGNGVRTLTPETAVQSGNIAPAYPLEAQRAGWEGEVLLHLYCDETGKVQDSKVEKTSGYRSLDEAARVQSLQWKFPPDQVGREATIPVLFKLD